MTIKIYKTYYKIIINKLIFFKIKILLNKNKSLLYQINNMRIYFFLNYIYF